MNGPLPLKQLQASQPALIPLIQMLFFKNAVAYLFFSIPFLSVIIDPPFSEPGLKNPTKDPSPILAFYPAQVIDK